MNLFCILDLSLISLTLALNVLGFLPLTTIYLIVMVGLYLMFSIILLDLWFLFFGFHVLDIDLSTLSFSVILVKMEYSSKTDKLELWEGFSDLVWNLSKMEEF